MLSPLPDYAVKELIHIIECEGLSVVYPGGIEALDGVDLEIEDGDFVVIVGLSGAGKSTLLRTMNRLVEPTEGQIKIDGEIINDYSKKELKELRSKVGMIFQNFNLVKRSTVIRNVLAGRLHDVSTWRTLLGIFPEEDIEAALSALDRVGIKEKAKARADELSGGQQQRVGIARALAQEPKILLADEPVASLDPPTSHAVMQDLKRINEEDGITTLVNLHFIDLAQEYGEKIIGLREGKLVYQGPASEVTEEKFEDIYGRSITADDQLNAGGENI